MFRLLSESDRMYAKIADKQSGHKNYITVWQDRGAQRLEKFFFLLYLFICLSVYLFFK